MSVERMYGVDPSARGGERYRFPSHAFATELLVGIVIMGAATAELLTFGLFF